LAYKDFKEYIQRNYYQLLKEAIDSFLATSYDGQGFHAYNVYSLLKTDSDNIQVCSLTCRDDIGPRIQVDVHVKADVVSAGLGTTRYEASRQSQWFTVYLQANLCKGLHDVEVLATDTYHPAKFDKNHALDEFFLQYVYSDQLEDIADDFTEFWLGDDIYDGWNSPLKKMLQELDLTWYDAELPQGEMGRMYFREVEAVIDDFVQEPGMHYPERRQIKRKIDPGTMLISHDYYFINGYGSKPDTIAHEIVHWDRHEKFFEILALLNQDEKTLFCESNPTVKSPEGLEGVAKVRWWAEWQANALAPRYLMPRRIFNKYFTDMLQEQRELYGGTEGEVMERALRQIAGVFDVTKYEAKLRALQLGYKQAEGAFLRVDGHERSPFSFNPDVLGDHQTFILDSKNAARLYKEDSHFAELIDSKRFVYTGHVVVINNPLYVIKTGDPSYPQGYKLTDFALGHVDLCCLIFTRNYTQNDAIAEYYDQCYFSKEVNVADFKETRTIDYSVNKDVEAEALGLKGYDDESERLAEILAPLPGTFWGTFDAHMNRLKKEEKLTNEIMSFRTGLSERYIRALRKGDQNVQRNTVYALAIAMHLHPYLSEDFVRKGGGYPATKEGLYYRTLIERHYPEPLSYINEKLKARGYQAWGDESKILDLDENAIPEEQK